MGGIAPMVITTDSKRAGATEQLAAFTRLLGVPLLVASHPETVIGKLCRITIASFTRSLAVKRVTARLKLSSAILAV